MKFSTIANSRGGSGRLPRLYEVDHWECDDAPMSLWTTQTDLLFVFVFALCCFLIILRGTRTWEAWEISVIGMYYVRFSSDH